MTALGCNIPPVSHVSIKIREATLPKLRMLSALTGKRITTLLDEWATAELARLAANDSGNDTGKEDLTGSDDTGSAHQDGK
jgi:hypothetical protein